MCNHGQVLKLWRSRVWHSWNRAQQASCKDSWRAIHIKQGTYLPDEAPVYYPLEHAENEPVYPPPDPFELLRSKITLAESESSENRNWLHLLILDKSAFNECIKTLSNNKPLGSDGIVSELLRMLPIKNLKHHTHMRLVIMWLPASHQKPGEHIMPSLLIKIKEMKLRCPHIAQLALQILLTSFGHTSLLTFWTRTQRRIP